MSMNELTNNPVSDIHYINTYNLNQSSNLVHHQWKFIALNAQITQHILPGSYVRRVKGMDPHSSLVYVTA